MALLKICKCGKKIDYRLKYCDECKAKVEEQQKQRHKDYKYKREDKWEQGFYSSTNWERAKKIVKVRDKGLCQICLSENTITLMDVVHHIIELKEDRSKAVSVDNLICLCAHHHQLVHKAYVSNRFKMQNELRELVGRSKKFKE